ncbi:MAG: CBS domain-containing protein [Calditrichaeota bacterium]|nr:MAG: CBS domain-containing protein [Calditrichota bacterium]
MKRLLNTRLISSFRRMQRHLQERVTRAGIPEYAIFSLFAIITGASVGFTAVFFHETIHFFTEFFFGIAKRYQYLIGGVVVILVPVLGMLIQSLMIRLTPLTARRRGVAEVIKAVAVRGGYIPFRVTLFHFLAPAICMGTGGTVGPEGPAAQIGAGVASKLGSLFGFSDSRRRMFTAAGAGAAIAAIFNTPLGGIFFALEVVLLNDFQSTTFSALILASIAASAVSRIFLGDTPAFMFDTVIIGPYKDLYLYALLGLGGGIISLLYIRYSQTIHHLFQKHLIRKFPQWSLMAAVGLLTGIAGFFYPPIFGFGYDAINGMLAHALPWKIIIVLMILKFLLVPLTLHSGGFGGVFAPSLFMGACFGFLYAHFLNHVMGIPVDTTAYTLVAMGAVLGGINSIPISSILIIFEMTRDYSFILPLMLGVVLSTTVVQLVIKGSVHSKHLEAEGYRITRGRESHILHSIRVKDVMRKDVILIPEHTPLPRLISELIESPHNTFYTIDTRGKLTGVITESELRPIITDYENLRTMLVASDISRPEVITVREDDDLEYVFNLFGQETIDELPVVSASDPDKVIGTIHRQDVIAAYNRESLKYNLADGIGQSLKTLEKTHAVHIARGYSIVERKAPSRFVGKTLAQLRLRNKYGLEVLMIRPHRSPFEGDEEPENFIVPTPDYIIQPEDTLVLFGKDENIAETNKWR